MNPATIKVVLAGNPNCGKTSVFNLLCKTHQKVGNYPGVTVERKVGRAYFPDFELRVIDLPGTYSLIPSSLEERIARDQLIAEHDSIILNIVDGTNLQRNLYLTTQLLEMQRPMILLVNMADEMEQMGLQFTQEALEKDLGVPVLMVCAHQIQSRDLIGQAIARIATTPQALPKGIVPLNRILQEECLRLASKISPEGLPKEFRVMQWLEGQGSPPLELADELNRSLNRIREIYDESAAVIMAEARYRTIQGVLSQCLKEGASPPRLRRDLDRFLTSRTLGLPIFMAIVYITFQLVFTLGAYPMDWIEQGTVWLQETLTTLWPKASDSHLKSLLVDGVLGGVGGVIIFLPNIVLLFLAIAFLDGTGYMARAAFIMDRIMRGFGLHGKSFMPLASGLGCTVPSIMATRILENQVDRFVTLMMLPMVSCSARLPIYGLLIPVFFPLHLRGLVLFLIYLTGIVILVIGAKVLRRTMFQGEPSAFLLELPPLRMPTLRFLWEEMWLRSKIYLRKAGTVILVCSILLWALGRFPRLESNEEVLIQELRTSTLQDAPHARESLKAYFAAEDLHAGSFPWEPQYKSAFLALPMVQDTDKTAEDLLQRLKANEAVAEVFTAYDDKKTALQNDIGNQELMHSFAGRIGRFFEPLFAPIGFDWKIVTALLGAVAAKEVFVSQFAIVYGMGADIDMDAVAAMESEDSRLARAIKNDTYPSGHARAGERVFSPLVAISLMIFCLVSTPCMSTIAVTIRETNSVLWGLWQFFGFSLLAWVLSFVIFQAGNLLNLS